MTSYTPGQVTAKTGFSLDTVRYYEKMGLLAPVGWTAGGRGQFTGTDVHWLLLLRCLRETGMPIARMLRFVELSRTGEGTVADRITLLEEHDQQLDNQLEALRANQGQIQAKIRYYRSRRPSQVDDEGDRSVVQQGHLHVGSERTGLDAGPEVAQRHDHGVD